MLKNFMTFSSLCELLFSAHQPSPTVTRQEYEEDFGSPFLPSAEHLSGFLGESSGICLAIKGQKEGFRIAIQKFSQDKSQR
jgi:hypothetical protein